MITAPNSLLNTKSEESLGLLSHTNKVGGGAET